MILPRLRKCFTYTKYAAGTVFVASMTSAWYYRPIPDYNNNNCSIATTQPQTNPRKKINSTNNDNDDNNDQPRHHQRKEFFCAPQPSPPWNREKDVPILLEWARRISIGVTTVVIRVLMNTYGQYKIEEDDHYHAFLNTVLERTPHQGLITVSNHRSLFDDPGIVSCLLPLSIAIQPKYNRWGICSQEYCFNDALPGLIKGYIGAGQVLPICRGGGLHQRLLLNFARHLANGEWCHIFPEGGVWQWDELGGRRQLPPNTVAVSSSDFEKNHGSRNRYNTNDDTDSTGAKNNASTMTTTKITKNKPLEPMEQIIFATKKQRELPPSPIGKLKWGVGKLIAHAPVTPKVIPFAHKGMETLLPQDEITGKTRLRENIILRTFFPSVLSTTLSSSREGGGGGDMDRGGSTVSDKLNVTVRFGKEILFDDLIAEHEKQYGKLWKYNGASSIEEEYHSTGRTNSQAPMEQQRQHQPDISNNERSQDELWSSSSEAERALYSKIARRIEYHLEDVTRQVCKEGKQ